MQMPNEMEPSAPTSGGRRNEKKQLLGAFVEAAVMREWKLLGANELASSAFLMHQAIALLLQSRGQRLPEALVRALAEFEAHGRRRNRSDDGGP